MKKKERPSKVALTVVLYFFMMMIAIICVGLCYLIYQRDGIEAFKLNSSAFPNMF